MTAAKKLEVLLTFDTTGSNWPALNVIRTVARNFVRELFSESPGVRVAVGVHGDYRDYPYETRFLDFTKDEDKVVEFIMNAAKTNGFGNGGECYELVLHNARSLDWSRDTSVNKAIVMIGDEPPHDPSFHQNILRLNWRNELDELIKRNIRVYGVQSLNWGPAADRFYKELAERTGGFHIRLDQFSSVVDTIMAIVYKEEGDDKVREFEERIERSGRMSRSLDQMFTQLLPLRDRKGRFVKADLNVVAPGRFQILEVPKDTRIDQFVESEGLEFERGRGFYEFTKTETIQANKLIVLQDKQTGDLFDGDYAYQLLGIRKGVTVRIKPVDLDKFRVFVQSTSLNRKLISGTSFLYEVKY